MTYVLMGVLGTAAGVLAGLFGVGGGVVIVPALVLLAKLDQHTATGTSLGALLLPVGILGVLEYHRRGQLNIAYAAAIAVGVVVGALLGAKLAGVMSAVLLRRVFGVFLLFVAGKLLLS
ncbi:MAG: sulfite exporter TauE/SafE family protein [Gemmatimonadetes bacterium]|nr:sulfite exporter TauE/SafE family protein [Gemmatimonadota bacterium]